MGTTARPVRPIPTFEPLANSGETACETPSTDLMKDKARCEAEISNLKNELRRGHSDIEGLCLALSDWAGELRMIEQEMGLARKPAAAQAGRAGTRTETVSD
jgi:hypothetical protein